MKTQTKTKAKKKTAKKTKGTRKTPKPKVVKKKQSKSTKISTKGLSDRNYVNKDLPISQIRVSLTDIQKERRLFLEQIDNADFDASIKRNGVLQPITVIKISPNQYEIVAGENRFTSAKKAGHNTIPCIIRDLTLEQIEEIQITENLQRQDNHPLVEASIFKVVMERYNLDVTGVAKHLNKKIPFVAKRLKLNDLPDNIKKQSHLIPIGILEEIAKFPLDQQGKIFDLAQAGYDIEDGFVTVAKLRRSIEREITLDLAFAPFDIKDEKLVRNAPACVKCPKRTGS